jgi:hypothetical protein
LFTALGQAPESPFAQFAKHYGARQFVDAAEVCARLQLRPDEAYARLRAAENLVSAGRSDEAAEQLELALAFWRSVGANRYVRRGEALLAESA